MYLYIFINDILYNILICGMKLLNKDQNKYKYKICKYMFYKQNKQNK